MSDGEIARLHVELADALNVGHDTPWAELIATVRAQRRDLMFETGEDPDAQESQ